MSGKDPDVWSVELGGILFRGLSEKPSSLIGLVTEERPVGASEKPRLRGWLHAFMLPLAFFAGGLLVATSPTRAARIASAVFATTAVLLFGVSALLHRGSWSPPAEDALRRIDHANIYLIIAGSYTPFAVLALPPGQGRTLLSIVWAGAVAGVILRVSWTAAPRPLTTSLYVLVGWIAVFFLPGLIDGAGVPAVILIIVGGVLYTIGAVVYATRRPNPSPTLFGFHEVFHALTIAAFTSHYIAVWIVAHA